MRVSQGNLTLHGTTFLLWAGLAASAVFWGLRLSVAGPGAAPVVLPSGPGVPLDTVAVSRLLGVSPGSGAATAAPSLASRFSLLGVVAGRSREGAALIAIDGKPPRPFRVGASVEEGLLLQSVEARRALLGPAIGSPAVITLELPLTKRAESRAPTPPDVRPDGRGPGRSLNPADGRNESVGVRTQSD